MKRIILNSCLLLAAAMIFSCNKNESKSTDHVVTGTCLPSGLNTGVLAYYSFGNGSTADMSGYGHNLVNPTNAVATTDRAGNTDCAYLFNGYSFLTSSNTAYLDNLSQFSVSLWYEPLDTTDYNGNYQVLMCRDTDSYCPYPSGAWCVGLYDCRKAFFGADGDAWDNNIFPPAQNACYNEVLARTGSWHHLAATYDKAHNRMAIYRDGVLQQSNPFGGCSVPPVTMQDTNVYVGKQFIGKLDDIIIYNRALTQAEVTQLSAAGTCCMTQP